MPLLHQVSLEIIPYDCFKFYFVTGIPEVAWLCSYPLFFFFCNLSSDFILTRWIHFKFLSTREKFYASLSNFVLAYLEIVEMLN